MNKTTTTLFFLTLFGLSLLNLSAQGAQENPSITQSSPSVSTPKKGDADGDSLPNDTEQLLGTNPYLADTDGDGQPDASDDNPLSSSRNLVENSSSPLPVKVLDARVEDNYKAADHLEITLKNTASADLALQDCTIVISDKASSAGESYYVDMAGFVLKPGVKTTLHFDNGSGPGHFPGNINGLYRTAAEGLTFDVLLHSQGYQPLPVRTEKAPGTAEVAD